jgi:hypothetical protein
MPEGSLNGREPSFQKKTCSANNWGPVACRARIVRRNDPAAGKEYSEKSSGAHRVGRD